MSKFQKGDIVRTDDNKAGIIFYLYHDEDCGCEDEQEYQVRIGNRLENWLESGLHLVQSKEPEFKVGQEIYIKAEIDNVHNGDMAQPVRVRLPNRFGDTVFNYWPPRNSFSKINADSSYADSN